MCADVDMTTELYGIKSDLLKPIKPLEISAWYFVYRGPSSLAR